MTAGIKANSDGSAAIQVGGTDVITLTSGGAATFVTSPTTVQAGTAAAPSITFSGDTNTGIYSPGADTIAFTEGGVESMRIDSAGNVGLGVTPSAWSGAHKAIQIGNSALSAFTNNINYVYLSTNWVSSSGDKYISNGAAAVYAQDTGSHIFYSAPSGTAGNAATFTQVMSVERTKTLALEGAVSQSGTGITFPATQSASSNANTLDDYEEGTWTPALYDGANNRNPTYTSGPSGTFQKIGKWVYLRWGFRINSKGTSPGSGEVRIYGLPFTSVTSGPYQEPNVSVGTGNLVTAANAGIARMIVTDNGTFLFGRVANNGDTTWTYNDLQTGTWIFGEIFYETTA